MQKNIRFQSYWLIKNIFIYGQDLETLDTAKFEQLAKY